MPITLAAAEAHGGIIKLPPVEIPEDAVLPSAREGKGSELACGFPGFDYSAHADAYINADADIASELINKLYSRDPYRAEREKEDPHPFPYIFSLDELVEYFRGLE